MKALTLTQPWATLVAIAATHSEGKRRETRSWVHPHRGPLAIHAAKTFPRDCRALCYQQPFARVLARAFYNMPEELPLGAILALVDLTDVQRVAEQGRDHARLANGVIVSGVEYEFGDYAPGRGIFQLDNIRRIARPVRCLGALGIWDVPADVEAAMVAQLT